MSGPAEQEVNVEVTFTVARTDRFLATTSDFAGAVEDAIRDLVGSPIRPLWWSVRQQDPLRPVGVIVGYTMGAVEEGPRA